MFFFVPTADAECFDASFVEYTSKQDRCMMNMCILNDEICGSECCAGCCSHCCCHGCMAPDEGSPVSDEDSR